MTVRIDVEIKIIDERSPRVFEHVLNTLLQEGCWRIAETHVSVTDNHYSAMLVKSKDGN